MIEKTKEEAARFAAKYWGCKAITEYTYSNEHFPKTQEVIIDSCFINNLSIYAIKSFQIKLRSTEEMTEEEMKRFRSILLDENENIDGVYAKDMQGDMIHWAITPDRVDYLDSIGVDTRGLKNVIIEIK